jgi:NAD(P)H-hydrate repair Nnr-like enzyme with NAD(P)H-hydrate dehydratase domain
MATAGSGDVLSGMIASLVGQRFSPFDAAKLGVYLHGRSADLALIVSQIPLESIVAETLIDHIAPTIRELDSNAIQ